VNRYSHWSANVSSERLSATWFQRWLVLRINAKKNESSSFVLIVPYTQCLRPNDCRINCKTASHGDGDRGTPPAPSCRIDLRAACRRRAWNCPSRPLGRRANKRRFVNFLQLLGGSIIVLLFGRAILAKQPATHS